MKHFHFGAKYFLCRMITTYFSEWGLVTDVAENTDCSISFDDFGMLLIKPKFSNIFE